MGSLPRLAAFAFAVVLAACGSKSPPAAEPEPAPEPAADAPSSECDRACAENCMADEYQTACIEDCGCNPDEVLNTEE